MDFAAHWAKPWRVGGEAVGERVVDARYLEPPEPFLKTMEALAELDTDVGIESIRLLLFREPFPLYKVLDQNGYRRETTQADDGTYAITIRRAGLANGAALASP
jgi:hypothetical protein